MNKLMCVIGSGPSGVACAHTLLKAGHQVELIDVGFALEAESQNLLSTYRAEKNTDEIIKNIHRLRQKHRNQSHVQPVKALFGSEHPYKVIQDTFVEADDKAVVRSSLAKGGFSTVWGATVSTVVPKDIEDWPITFDDLKPYYTSLDEIVDVSSPTDELSEVFPMNIGQPPTFPLGLQANDLFTRLQEHRKELADDGMYIGRAKVAIGAKYSLDGKGCTPCGLCMHGCPNNAIFNSSFLLESFQKFDNFTYRNNSLVESFSEGKEGVHLYIKDIHTGRRSTFTCGRVFLACGVINTTCIVARSLKLIDQQFTILDSQKYIFPLFRWHRSKGAIKAKENTSAQIYMTIDNPSISPNVVQLQYYGYNDLYLDALRRKLGCHVTELIPKFSATFFERLMVGFVYIHSNQSGTMSLKVHELDRDSGGMGEIRGHMNPKSQTLMNSLLRLLKRHHRAHGGIPIGLGVQGTLPGDSQHIGGTLPMSKSPSPYKTDYQGRPFGCKRVHVVDASVLPSIPGTPIVYTVMANSCRIADLAIRNQM